MAPTSFKKDYIGLVSIFVFLFDLLLHLLVNIQASAVRAEAVPAEPLKRTN